MRECRPRPAQRALHRLPRLRVPRRILQALVQHHHNVAPERQLHVHGGFRREQVRVAVQVRAEQHPFVRHLPQIAQAENLVAAGIRQDGPRPAHEPVQPSQRADRFVARPKIKMIRVGQQDAHVQIGHQVPLRHALDRGLRAHRHEHRCLYVPMRRVQHARPRPCPRALGDDLERYGGQASILAGSAGGLAAGFVPHVLAKTTAALGSRGFHRVRHLATGGNASAAPARGDPPRSPSG